MYPVPVAFTAIPGASCGAYIVEATSGPGGPVPPGPVGPVIPVAPVGPVRPV